MQLNVNRPHLGPACVQCGLTISLLTFTWVWWICAACVVATPTPTSDSTMLRMIDKTPRAIPMIDSTIDAFPQERADVGWCTARLCATTAVYTMRTFAMWKVWTTLLHPFNGLFSGTTWVSRYQKGKTSLDLNEARDDGVLRRRWHQLDRMQAICTSPHDR